MKSASLRIIAAIILLSFGLEARESERPNVVFFLIDDLGVMDLGCYGSSFHESPEIDRLAKEGMRFTNAYASHAVCGPSRQAIMTGRTPARLGIVATTGRLREEDYVWPKALQEIGYKTFFAGKWHLGDSDSVYRFGFDVNVAGGKMGQPADFYFPYKSHAKRTTFDVPGMEDGKPGDYLTDAITTKALRFIDENKDEPFLMYLSYYAVHKPGIPGVWAQGKKEHTQYFEKKLASQPPYEGPVSREVTHGPSETVESLVQNNAEFASQIKAVDDNVGRVMAKLRELDLDENTIVVFTSDQGSVTNSRQMISSAQPYHMGKSWLFEGGIRVPLIVHWPGKIAAGATSELYTYNTDHFPTILDLLGRPLMPERHMDGASIKPELFGQSMELSRPYYWVYTSHQMERQAYRCVAYRDGKYKLIYWFQHDHVELYNIESDVGETRDLSDSHPEIRKRLMDSLLKIPYVASVVETPYEKR